MRRALALAAPAALLVALAGCVNLAPAYHRPAPVTPDVWPAVNGGSTPAPENGPAAATIGWRSFFLDAKLRDVVRLALAQNRNLRIAALDIEQARERYRATGAALFPTIAASASATVSKAGSTQHTGGSGSGVTKSERAELGFASYELDFFGKLRNEKQQALETLNSSVATRQATQISLIAEAANDWLTLAADRALLELAQQTEANQRRNLQLVQARHRYGIAAGSDVAVAEQSVATAREDVATYTSQVAQDRDALNLVVGTTVPAADLPAARVPSHAVLTRLPAGVPSRVLAHRPDVRAAEYTLRGDYANIGAARAAFFPNISLTAAAGFATAGLTGLFASGNGTWSFSPQINLPLFDAGANLAALHITKTQRRIDVAQYEQTIQTAFREVADALATRATIHEQIAAQQALVNAAQRAYDLSMAQYRAGTASALDTLTTQRTLYSARQTAIGKQLARATNLVTLYKVLGGGTLAGSPVSAAGN